MTWKFVASDNYSLDDLLEYRVFFLKDLQSAEREVKKHLELEKWGLPNWRIGMIRRQMGVEESESNIRIVDEAITIATEKGL